MKHLKLLNNYIDDCHKTALDKGWWSSKRSVGDCIALMHSELSEALECYRSSKKLEKIEIVDQKPEGFVVELADVIIRIFDFCKRHNLDLERALQMKMEYNKTRPYRHGGKNL